MMQMPSSEAIFQYNCQHGTAEGIQVMLSQMLSSDPDSVHYFVNKRNSLRYAPLHTAIFARNLGTCKALLECGEVDLDLKCHGTPILHLVLNTAVLPEGREFGLELFRLLVAQEKIDLSARDDQLATAVHVASEYNLVDCLKVLLSVSEAFDVDAKDRTGMRPLHRAASRDAADAAKFLLASGAAQIDPQTPYGSTPLHVAAASCAPAVWKVLVEAGADPSAPALLDCWGRSPADIVALNGWKLTDKKRAVLVGPGAGAGEKESAAAAAAGSGSGSGSTAIITHPICRRHYTCEPSSTEDPSAPPENVKRLHVVIDEKHGALWGSDLAPSLSWVPQCRPAAMSDVLRVHEWPYVRRIQGFCDSIPSDPEGEGGIGSLDGDTTLCHDSFTAALCAAGAVTHGVDMVCRGQARNAFAPVRPPGHHAGPKGLVKGRDGGPDSHGFCLLNNVSIGAAYALNVHRDTIKRVAIVDFDVHHGNGTEETIRWLKPGVEDVSLVDSSLFGSLAMPRYKPWFDQADTDNVLFVSVHGYGPREQGLEHLMPQAAFYPGSGKTVIPEVTTPGQAAAAAAGAGAGAGAGAAAGQGKAKGKQPLSDATFTAVRSSKGGDDDDEDGDNDAEDDDDDDDDDEEDGDYDGEQAMAVNDDDDDDDDDEGESQQQGQGGQDEDEEQDGGARIQRRIAAMRRLYTRPLTVPAHLAADAAAAAESRTPVPPLILDVGVPLPDSPETTSAEYRHMWRNYFRDNIFPRMMQFKPDLVLISAGFDAHKKDTINGGYIALVEEDFEWVTGHLVRIANASCGGRVVSVLEGGYQILGEHCSAFAKSVKAHVAALASGGKSSAPYSQADADAETALEKRLLDEAAARRAEKLALQLQREEALREARRQELAAAAAAAAAAAGTGTGPAAAVAAAAGAESSAADDASGLEDSSRKRRRAQVDYAALDKKLKEENGGGEK